MPNREHLRILNCGVETWNQWRKAKPAIKPNLRHIRLIGPNLIEQDNKANEELKRADISPAELSNANFSETDLSGSLLMGAELTGADLQMQFSSMPVSSMQFFSMQSSMVPT